MENITLELRGGTLLDPETGRQMAASLFLQDDRIVYIGEAGTYPARKTVELDGLTVIPGLVDFHAHFFHASQTGISPELGLVAGGVTAAADAGSCGVANLPALISQMADLPLRYRAYLNVSPAGLASIWHHEIVEPERWDEGAFCATFNRYPDVLAGLKLRLDRSVAEGRGVYLLEKTLALAEKLGTCVCVHVAGADTQQKEVLRRLRPGDIYCHVYHGNGETVLEDGVPCREAFEAKERGVILDACHGKSNLSLKVAKRCIEAGLTPNVISSDLSAVSYLDPTVEYGLAYVMSKFLALGMDLGEVVKTATTVPAALLGLDAYGLRPGAFADLTVLRIKKGPVTFTDCHGNTLQGDTLLVPEMTVIGGKILYRSPIL